MQLEKLVSAKERAYRAVRQKAGASRSPFVYGRHYAGVGIGHKNGDPKRDLCLRFYVRRKLGPGDVPPSHLIEGSVAGVPTDVVEVGTLIAYGGSPGALPAATLRYAPGSGIRYDFQGVAGPNGTIAAVLADGQGNRYALTANHVLARNGAPLVRPGFQVVDTGMPGPVLPPEQLIGRAVTFAGLGNGSSVDCAMVKADDPGRLKQLFPAQLGAVTDAVAEPAFHSTARKFGYTTGFTEGTVLDQFANIQIDFGVGLGVIHFANAALISGNGGQPFATHGDSGALAVQQNAVQQNGGSWDPMGLVVGGTEVDVSPDNKAEDCVFVCPLSQVLAQLTEQLGQGAGTLALAHRE